MAIETEVTLSRLETVHQTLSELLPEQREILFRFYLEEQSKEKICTEMGLEESQFRLAKSQAKARFIEQLPRIRPDISKAG